MMIITNLAMLIEAMNLGCEDYILISLERTPKINLVCYMIIYEHGSSMLGEAFPFK